MQCSLKPGIFHFCLCFMVLLHTRLCLLCATRMGLGDPSVLAVASWLAGPVPLLHGMQFFGTDDRRAY